MCVCPMDTVHPLNKFIRFQKHFRAIDIYLRKKNSNSVSSFDIVTVSALLVSAHVYHIVIDTEVCWNAILMLIENAFQYEFHTSSRQTLVIIEHKFTCAQPEVQK